MNIFSETESDFYQYLVLYGGVNKHSRTNYMSWLKFLDQDYQIDRNITEEYIDFIVESERDKLNQRDIYTSEKDLTNFKSALRKYKSFVNSDFHKKQEETILTEINKIKSDKTIPQTEKISIVKSRVGQGNFRNSLIKYWGGCSISGYGFLDVLIASHIKPWFASNNRERLCVYNGLLLLPNFDKLFDKGYISFSTNGKIIISTFLPQSDRQLLGLSPRLCLSHIEEEHKSFILFHNENCLIQ